MRRALIALFLAPCGGSAARPTAPAAAEGGIAPRPYTAEQIRDAMPVGSELRYQLEEAGKPTVTLVMRVTAADAKTGTIASQVLAADGRVVQDDAPKTSEWSELMRHATFPADATVMSEGTVETPAGSWPSVDYVVRSKVEEGVITTYRFARTMPGPPVILTQEKNGEVVSRMTLLSRR